MLFCTAMKSSFCFLLVLVSLALLPEACSVGFVRVQRAEPSAGLPRIDRLVDLGGLALPSVGPIDARESDGIFTPGEWVAVVGENLGENAAVLVDNKPLPVEGFLAGGSLLVRVPRGLSPRAFHQFSVTTQMGRAGADWPISSYVVAADPNGNALEFLRIGPDSKEVLDRSPTVLPVDWARGHAFSPSGSLLYVIQSPQGETDPVTHQVSYSAQLKVVHLGAKAKPRAIADLQVRLSCPPTAVAALGDSIVLVLGERELAVVDVSHLDRMSAVGRLVLADPNGAAPELFWTEVVPINNGRQAVLLETNGNRLALIDLVSLAAPRLLSEMSVAAGIDLPVTVGIGRDPDDAAAVWVLQGPNVRIGTEKARQVYARLMGTKGAAAASPTNRKTQSGGSHPETPGLDGIPRVLRVRATEGELRVVETRALPEGFNPLYFMSRPGGVLIVSGVNSKVFEFAGVEASTEGASKVLSVLGDSLQFGRIIKMSESDSPVTVIQGPALYFNLDVMPEVGLVYSTWRLGVGGFPPGPKVKWGVEVEEHGFSDFGSLSWKSIIPPYAFSVFAVQ